VTKSCQLLNKCGLILCVNECLWIAYALATDQYGFIAMAIAYAAVYIKSYIHWKKDEKEGVANA